MMNINTPRAEARMTPITNITTLHNRKHNKAQLEILSQSEVYKFGLIDRQPEQR